MDFPISVPSVGLVDGKFVDEDPLAGTPGSLIPAQWGNAVTEEVLNVITSAGLVPDESNNTQLKTAIDAKVSNVAPIFASQLEAEGGTNTTKVMSPLRVFQAIATVVTQATEAAFGWLKIATQSQVIAGTDDTAAVTSKKLAEATRSQAAMAFTTTGTGSAYLMTPVPTVTALAANQRYTVQFHASSTVTPTINISSLGAKRLKQYTSAGVKIDATLVAGQISDVIYDGTDLVVMDALPPTGIVQATETVLGGAEVATQTEVNTGTDDATMVTPKKLRFGVSMSLGANGYISLPSWLGGLMIQWGQFVTGTTTTTHNYPAAFPAEVFQVFVSDAGVDTMQYIAGSALSNTQFQARCNSGTAGFSFWAIGR